MSYGTEAINDQAFFGISENDNPNQLDVMWFTDCTSTQSTLPLFLDGGIYYTSSANGGSIAANAAAAINGFGYTACSGVVNLQTGSTNNATGYCSATTSMGILPGIPVPQAGQVTKYEYEATIRPLAVHSNTVRGAFRLGFSNSNTNTTPTRGVYYEFLCNGTVTDSTWKVVIQSASGSTRIDTGVTASATTIYRMYLSTEASVTGAYTTNYKIKNISTGYSQEGTATPSSTGHYPSASTDYLGSTTVNTKAVTATTTSVGLTVDYIGTRIRRPVSREILIAPVP